jgi:septal ring factor EnvC (AmiA/AmiB activator)
MNQQANYFSISSKAILGFCLMMAICWHSPLVAQNKKELQSKKAQLKDEIEFTNKLLSETKQQKKVSIGQLVTLSKKINTRQELINTISGEITTMDQLIKQNYHQIQQKQGELEQLKKDYARMLVYAYKNRGGYKLLMFVFAAHDFNQAYKRLKYLQQYGEYRKKQATLIRQKQLELNDQIAELQGKKTSQTHLLTSNEAEKMSLSEEKIEQEQLVSSLKSKEKQLKKDLKEKQEAERQLTKAIEEAIRKEMEMARKKAEAAAKARAKAAAKKTAIAKKAAKSKVLDKVNPAKTNPEPVSEPEAKVEIEADPITLKLTANFEDNKGHLPWPVDRGVITGSFGIHPHPALRGIMVNNNGVDINAAKGANARAVFEGQVTRVLTLPGSYAVLVQHGDYWSVYSNLAEVTVHAGDKVQAKQSLGTVRSDDDDAKAELHLEIWKGQSRQNPADWLLRR